VSHWGVKISLFVMIHGFLEHTDIIYLNRSINNVHVSMYICTRTRTLGIRTRLLNLGEVILNCNHKKTFESELLTKAI
jgi:hypothetical protein